MIASSFSYSRVDWLESMEVSEHDLPNLSCLTPMLLVPDVQKAILFYEKVFGFIPVLILPDNRHHIHFARMRYRGTNFTLTSEGDAGSAGNVPVSTTTTPPLCFYLYVDNVLSAYADALRQGCKPLEQPHKEWGDNKARIVDVFGYIWDIAAKL